ncbi:hypothetical protein D3C83_326660 [compost metagenome]
MASQIGSVVTFVIPEIPPLSAAALNLPITSNRTSASRLRSARTTEPPTSHHTGWLDTVATVAATR